MPGDVIRAHADIEGDCRKCHQPFRATTENDLCLDCHTDIGADIRARRGFHGRAPEVPDAMCRSCHTEHVGRDADVVGLNRETFDHGLTDHVLRGAHRSVACDSCHGLGATYREAPDTCVECHREDDPHEGRIEGDCATCHVERSWAEKSFDHASTAYPLEGKHRDVACSLCHPGDRYEDTVTGCGLCHGPADVHRGRFGSSCENCHSPLGWNESGFDHGRDTQFLLEGSHRDAKCESCHTGEFHQRELPTDCNACHRVDDVHRGNRGTDCGDCHSPRNWETATFDHDANTKFPLRGAHGKAACEVCHAGVLQSQQLETSCGSCHRVDDVHHGQQGDDCHRCHAETRWHVGISFDHDLSAFPLLGLHAATACDQCHMSPRFKDAEVKCVRCHAESDVHLGRLGPSCARCHNPNGWKVWRFDHDTETSFPLREAHIGLDCHSCHRVPAEEDFKLSNDCSTCHMKDDKHLGAFGNDCGRCHTENRWDDVRSSR